MNTQSKSLRRLGVGLVAAATILTLSMNLQVRPAAVGAGTAVSLELSIGAKAHAFDPVSFVWEKFKHGVLDKVTEFIRKPIDAAKDGLQKLINTAIEKIKTLFSEKVLTPALVWALEKIFPKAEKILAYAQQIVGKVEGWMNIADKYANAVDALIVNNANKFSSVMGEVTTSMDVIQKFNLTMVVDILIVIAKEKAAEYIKSKAIELLDWAYGLIEGPIELGKAAACTAIGSIPFVGGLLRGAADFIITKGLVLLRDKGFAFVAEQAVKLGDMAITAIGDKLKGLAGKVDEKIAPFLDKVKGFISKIAGYIGPIKDAFSKVTAGLNKAQQTVAAMKSKAQTAVGR